MKKFWEWYEKHHTLNIGIAAILFSLQIIHLYWLTTHVVFSRLFGQSLYFLPESLEPFLLFVDYLEIPTLVSVSLVYINQLRKKYNHKSLLYLIFLNSQWLHIFWITDEFVEVVLTGSGAGTVLPAWLAWIAIFIDYLELPVIYDTIKEFIKALKEKGVKDAMEVLKEND